MVHRSEASAFREDKDSPEAVEVERGIEDQAGLEVFAHEREEAIQEEGEVTIRDLSARYEGFRARSGLSEETIAGVETQRGYRGKLGELTAKIQSLIQSTREKVLAIVRKKGTGAEPVEELERTPELTVTGEASIDGLATQEFPERNLSFSREDLERVLDDPDYSPEKLLDLVRPDFERELGGMVGTHEGYDLETHLRMQMGQFEKYFANRPLPGAIDQKLFRVIDLFHDMGKPKAARERGKEFQHEETLNILRPALQRLGYTPTEINLAEAIINGDPMGEILKPEVLNKDTLEYAAEEFLDMADHSGIDPDRFWEVVNMFYQIDASSYTPDAGGTNQDIARLFNFDPEGSTIHYSLEAQVRIDELHSEVKKQAKENRQRKEGRSSLKAAHAETPVDEKQEQLWELREYLNHEIFPVLGISVTDERRLSTETSENRREVLNRSFRNTRDTVQAFYEVETVEGRVNALAFQEEMRRVDVEMTRPVLDKWLTETGFTEADLEEAGIVKQEVQARDLRATATKVFDAKLESLRKETERGILQTIANEGRYEDIEALPPEAARSFDDERNEQFWVKVRGRTEEEIKKWRELHGFTGDWLEPLRVETNKLVYEIRVDPDRFRVFRSREEVLEGITEETEKAKETGFLNVNITPRKLETVLEEGGVKGLFSLNPEELQEHARELNTFAGFYLRQRQATEEALGTYNPDNAVIYGTYGSENGTDEIYGGGISYGDIDLHLKPEVMERTEFSEGDSLTTVGHSRSVLKKTNSRGIDRLDYENFARARQVAREHAPLAKALINLDRQRQIDLEGQGDLSLDFMYLEAHIAGGISLDDIDSITVPRKIFEQGWYIDEKGNPKTVINKLLQDSRWKDKIHIVG